MELSLTDIVKKVGGEITGGSGEVVVKGVAPLDQASSDHITFLTSPAYASKVPDCRAAAIITQKKLDAAKVPQIIHPEPYVAMARVMQLFHKPSHSFEGQSEHAYVSGESTIDPSVTVYPNVYIEAGATIGPRTVLYPNCYIGRNVTIGADCILYPNVSIMDDCVIGDRCTFHAGCVIGADGFGFAPTKDENVKIPQIAGVRIGNDVEMQAVTVVDRGALEDTVVGDGSKFDAHVLVAHGVEIGKFALICGQTAIAGSAKIGDRLTMAGHSAIGPGIKVGDNVTLGGKAGLTGTMMEPGVYHGMPVSPTKEWRRQMIALKKLPDLVKTIRLLEEEIADLKGKSNSLG